MRENGEPPHTGASGAGGSQAGPLAWLMTILVVALFLVIVPLSARATPWSALNLLIALVATIAGPVGFLICVAVFGVTRKAYQALRTQICYPVEPIVRPLSLEDPILSPEVAQTLRAPGEALVRLGFIPVGAVRVEDAGMSGLRGYAMLYHDRRAGVVARSIVAVAPGRPGENLLTLQTRFSDGSTYNTVHTTPRTWGRMLTTRLPGRHFLVFFEIDDPARLARLHSAVVERVMSVHPSAPIDTGTIDPVRNQSELLRTEIEKRVAIGELALDSKNEVYRPTRRGAARMALRLLQPSSALRIHSARREADRFLRETGL
jgi:hypothetical protein